MTAAGIALVPALVLAAQAGAEIHGERDVFTAPGVVLVWAVLRTPVEDDTQVVVRVVLTETRYAYIRAYAVDPFTGDRQVMATGGRVSGMAHLTSLRRTFGDHPRREIRLYQTQQEWKADIPALTIYYLGLPDTTPEFTSEPALTRYLSEAVERARRD